MNILKRWLAGVLAFALVIGNTLGSTNITYADVIGPTMEKIEEITLTHPYSTTGLEQFSVNEDVSFSYWNSLTEESVGFDTASMHEWIESEKENSLEVERKVYEAANIGIDSSYAVAGMRFKNVAEVTFDYKTSCEEPVADEETGDSLLKDDFIVIVDDKIVLQVGGETEWTNFHYHVTEDGSVSTEEHEIYWIYSKDNSGVAGDDCAYLSNIQVDGEAFELVEDVNVGISLLSSGEEGTTVETTETTTAENAVTTIEQVTTVATNENTTEDTSAIAEVTIAEEAGTEVDANAGIATVSTEINDSLVAKIPIIEKKYVAVEKRGLFWTTVNWKLEDENINYAYYSDLQNALNQAKGSEIVTYADTNTGAVNEETDGNKKEGDIKIIKSTKPTVILEKNHVVDGNLEIPSGVTLLIPFLDPNTNSDSLESYILDSKEISQAVAWADGSAPNRKLTINGTLRVSGTLSVGGRIGGKDAVMGQTYASYGQLVNNGSIIISQQGENTTGGVMNAYGLVSGTGTIVAEGDGATIYEPVVLLDCPGGSVLLDLYTKGSAYFPISTYALNNIQCQTKIKYGGQLIGQASIITAYGNGSANPVIVGPEEIDSLFIMKRAEDASIESEVIITYDSSKYVNGKNAFGKNQVDIYGDSSIGSLIIEIEFLGTKRFDSTGKFLPLPYTFNLKMNNGTCTIGNRIYAKVLPGSTITVENEADLVVENGGKLLIYNGLKQTELNGAQYPQYTELTSGNKFNPAGQLFINGKLNVKAGGTFAGIVQTIGSGTIITDKDADLSLPGYRDGVNLTENNLTGFDIYAEYWNGYELVRMTEGFNNTYKAYDGAQESINEWDYSGFQSTYYVDSAKVEHTYSETFSETGEVIVQNCSTHGNNCLYQPYSEPGSNRTGAWNLTDIIYTADGDGYTIVPVEGCDKNPLPQGDTFKFKIVFDEGYSAASNFAVKVNGEEVANTGTEYEYAITISDSITNGEFPDQLIEVEGVVDAPPTGSIHTMINGTAYEWNNISDTETEIKAVDAKTNNIIDENIHLTIAASDTPNTDAYPVVIEYLTSSTPLSESDLNKYNQWKRYDQASGIVIPTDCNVYVYAKVTDTKPKGGNIVFLSTPQIIVDNHGPIGTITVGGDSWTGQSENPKNAYFTEKQTVRILQTDVASDSVKDIFYYKADTPITDLKSHTEWSVYDAENGISIGNENDESCYIYAKLEDGSGHISYASTGVIAVDNTSPSGSINTNNNTDVTGTSENTVYFNQKSNVSELIIAAQDNCAGVEKIIYKVNGQEKTVEGSEVRIPVSDGTYNVEATIFDYSGNSTSLQSKTIIIDTMVPKGSISIGYYLDEDNKEVLGDSWPKTVAEASYYNKNYYETYKNGENVEIVVNASDEGISELNGDILYYISPSKLTDFSNVEWENYSNDENFPTISLNCFQYIYVKIVDKAGNETILKAENFMIDNTDPNGSICIKEKNHLWQKFIETITFGAVSFNKTEVAEICGTDNESKVSKISYLETTNTYKTTDELELAVSTGEEIWFEESQNSDAMSSFSVEYNLTLDNIDHKDRKTVIYAKVEDNAGNVTYLSSDGIILDDTLPTATITIGQGGDVWNKTNTDEITYYNSDYFNEHKTEEQLELFIQCKDGEGSGTTNTIKYVVTDEPIGDTSSLTWNDYVDQNGKRPLLNPGKVQYVYFKISDYAGNENIISVGGMYLDLTDPTGTIQLKDSDTIWDKFLETITFGLFNFNDSKEVTVEGTDTDSGISTIYYMESTNTYSDIESLERAVSENNEIWSSQTTKENPNVLTETVDIEQNDKKVVIYVKLEDKSGNVSYLSSNGLIMDKTTPEAEMLIAGESVINTGIVTENESDTLYYRIAEKVYISGEVNLAPIDTIESWVIPIDADKTLSTESPYYECHKWTEEDATAVRDLGEETDSVVYARITDKAGNITEVHSKHIIVDTTPPQGSVSIGNTDISNEESSGENIYFDGSDCSEDGKLELDLTATDEGGSELTEKVYYIVSNEIIDVTQADDWKAYSDENKPVISPNQLTYVYAKIVDNAGNVTYVPSNPILLDTKKPETMISVADGEESWNDESGDGISYYGGENLQLVITGNDPHYEEGNGSGVASIYYRIKNLTSEIRFLSVADESDSWTLYTEPIILETNGKYLVEAKSVDNAGNETIVSTNQIVVDNEAPTAEVDVLNNKWNEFLNDITFGLFFNETQTVTISAMDVCSGVDKIQYIVSETAMTENQALALEESVWTEDKMDDGTVAFNVDPEKSFIVYIKVTDKSGNVEYISTNGIVLDTTKPVIKCDALEIDSSVKTEYEETEKSYGTESITVTIEETNFETVTLCKVVDENTTENIGVTVNNGSITIEPSKTYQAYLIKAVDKAGNETSCKFYYLEPCTVIFSNFNGSALETLSSRSDYKYRDSILQPADKPIRTEEKIKYVFAGWEDGNGNKYPLAENDGNESVNLPIVMSNSVTYSAYYDEVAYYVTIPESKEGEFKLTYSTEVQTGFMNKDDTVAFSVENLDSYNLCHFDVKVNGESVSALEDGTFAITIDKVMDITVTSVKHDYNDLVEKEATCTEAGGIKRTCKNCNREPEYIYLPKSGHNFGATGVIVTEPTCTKEGLQIGECSYCKEYAEEMIPATGHDYDLENEKVVTEETCKTSGLKAVNCKNCDDIKFSTIDPGHIVVVDQAKAPTCTENGLTEGSHCSRCGEILKLQVENSPATGHDWSEYSTKTPATCAEKGVLERACKKCDAKEETDIPVRNHNYHSTTTNPTCTEKGYTTYTCSYEDCGYSYIDEENYIEANGHSWGDWSTDIPATCTKDGKRTRTCTISTCKVTESEVILSSGHTYTEKIVEPTCTNEGYTLHVCNVCGDENRTDATSPKGHDWNNDNPDIIALETCTNPGVKVVVCKECSISNTVVTKATGHDYKETKVISPTCTEEGYTIEICNNCNDERHTNKTDALGHDTSKTEAKAPTCIEPGWDAYETCNRENCDYTTFKEMPATGHTEAIKEGKDATCTEDGVTDEIYCSVCNEVLKASVVIPKKGHITTVDKGYAASCTTEGLEDGAHCIVCGVITEEQKVISALKHDWDMNNARVINAPTCTNAGLKVVTCKRCDITKSVVDNPIGHNYETTNVIEKTCTTDGYTEQTCKNCGDVKHIGVETAFGHDLVTTEEQKPTCTGIGWNTYDTCSNCDYTTYKELPATGHTEAIEEGVVATCTKSGKTDRIYCSVCNTTLNEAKLIAPTGHTETINKGFAATCTNTGLTDGKHCIVCGTTTVAQKEIPVLGHNWDSENTKTVNEATCTAAGLKVIPCTRCGVTKSEVIDAKGHNYIETTVVEPTCTESGYTEETCGNCGDIRCVNEKDALTHDIESHEAQEVSCTEIGWVAYETCKREGCDYSTYEEIPATGHTEATETGKEPTCEETGLTDKVTCSVCNEVLTQAEEIPAKGHVETTVAGTNATCTQPGKTEGKYCIVCGKVTVVQEEIPALKHAWDTENAKVAVEPTCTEAGTNVETCKRCEITRTVVVDPIGHKYGTGVVTSPTCTEDGYTTYTCTNDGCNHTKQENPTEKLGHTEVVDNAVAPTCENDGLTVGSHCAVCNEVLTQQEVVPATKHNFGDWTIVVAATCEKAGEERRLCFNHGCSHYESRELKATGHSYTTEVTLPTCTEDGYTTYTCSTCGNVTKGDIVAADGHEYLAKVKDPTCESDGYTTFTCSVCDDTYNDYYKDKTGHTIVTDVGKTATCIETGLTEGSHCADCGKVLEGQEVIAALEHNFDDGIVVEATCETDGYTLKTCVRCDFEEKTNTVKAEGHSWCDEKDAHVITAPTCTTSGMTVFTCDNCSSTRTEYPTPYGHSYEKEITLASCTEGGYTTYVCSRCQDSYVEDKVEALGHSYVEYEGQEAGCETDGWQPYHVCTRCEESNYQVIEATGHVYKENTVNPTCTERGYTTYTCENCDYNYVGDYKDAMGHQMGEFEVTTAPTCTDRGLETSTCNNCDYSKTQEISKLGHNYETKVTDPTCTTDGYTTYSCIVCQEAYIDDLVNATGHNEVKDDAVKATCEEEGLTEGSHCANCGSVLKMQEVVDVLGHKEVIDKAVDATCENSGLTEGSHCLECGKVLKEQEVIHANGHNYGNPKIVMNPTCTTAGLVLETCSVCSDTRLGTLDQLEHEYEAKVTPPTCLMDGSTLYTCKLCNNTYIDNVVKATGHNYNIDITNPTCTEKGYTTYSCNNCTHSYVDDYQEPLGHSKVIDSGKVATCTEKGLTEGSHCERCNTVLTAQTDIPAKGHSYEAKVVAATCTTAGHTDYKCTRCQHAYSADMAKATGHTYVSSVTKEATESQNGTLTYKCKDCTSSYTRVVPADMRIWLAGRDTNSITVNWNNVLPDSKEKIGFEVWAADASGQYTMKSSLDQTLNTYTVSGLAPAVEYHIYVKTFTDVNGVKVYGENSNILTTITVPEQVNHVNVSSATYNSLTVNWTQNANAEGYEVYAMKGKDTYYNLVAEIHGNVGLAKVTGLKANTKYTFKVRAYTYLNGTKVYGDYSIAKAVTTKLKTPTVKLTTKSKKITIKWSKVSGASGYKIYRATSKNGKYKLIKTIKGNKKFTYTNTKLKKGKKYYYKVRAYKKVSGKTQYSAYSKVKYKKVK